MSIPNTRPLERRPIHPGEILREDFLPEYGLTVTALADAAGVSRQSVNELLRERRGLSAEMALRLGKLFGNSPEFWLNLQRNVDLWDAAQELKREIADQSVEGCLSNHDRSGCRMSDHFGLRVKLTRSAQLDR